MNGQNDVPNWLNPALKVGGILIAGLLAFTALQAQVNATDLVAQDNKVNVEKHEERLDSMQLTQIETVVLLRGMKETLDEIKEDLKKHDDTP